MILTELHRAILDLAVDDSFSLIEVTWRVRQLMPTLPRGEVRELARIAIGQLLHAGLVRLTKKQSVESPEEDLGINEALVSLEDDLAWADPTYSRGDVRVIATAQGRQAYDGLGTS